MISLYHTEPKVPIPELTLKVIAQLRSYFKHGMNKGVLLFDDLTHKLKKDHAHKIDIKTWKRIARNYKHCTQSHPSLQ